jgi:hypothetical protein
LAFSLTGTGMAFTMTGPNTRENYCVVGPGGRYGIRGWVAFGADMRGPVNERKTEVCLGPLSFFVPATPLMCLGLLLTASLFGVGMLWGRKLSRAKNGPA